MPKYGSPLCSSTHTSVCICMLHSGIYMPIYKHMHTQKIAEEHVKYL